MSDTTPAPDYNDGKGGNYDSNPDANAVAETFDSDGTTTSSDVTEPSPVPDFTPTDQVPTDNGGTTPDTTPTEPVPGEPSDTTTGAVEGGDVVEAGGPPPDPEAAPAPPAETDVVTPDTDIPEPEEAHEEPLGPSVGSPAEVPEVDVVDEAGPETDPELTASSAASEGDEHHVWTVWSRKRKAWFNVVEDEGIVGEPNGYRLKSSAKEEARDVAREREVIHFIQKKNGDVGEENSYGYRAKHEL